MLLPRVTSGSLIHTPLFVLFSLRSRKPPNSIPPSRFSPLLLLLPRSRSASSSSPSPHLLLSCLLGFSVSLFSLLPSSVLPLPLFSLLLLFNFSIVVWGWGELSQQKTLLLGLAWVCVWDAPGAGWRGRWGDGPQLPAALGPWGRGWPGHLGPKSWQFPSSAEGGRGALKVELEESSDVFPLRAAGPGGSGVSQLAGTQVGACISACSPPPNASLGPPPGAPLTRRRDPLGDWRAMWAADQEGEAETWRGRERGWRSREGREERAEVRSGNSGGLGREGEPEMDTERRAVVEGDAG